MFILHIPEAIYLVSDEAHAAKCVANLSTSKLDESIQIGCSATSPSEINFLINPISTSLKCIFYLNV